MVFLIGLNEHWLPDTHSQGSGVTAASRLETVQRLTQSQIFLSSLQMLYQQTFGSPSHSSTRESGPVSFIGVLEGTLLQARPLSNSNPNYFCTFGKIWSFLSWLLRAIGWPLLMSSSCFWWTLLVMQPSAVWLVVSRGPSLLGRSNHQIGTSLWFWGALAVCHIGPWSSLWTIIWRGRPVFY